MAISGNLPKHLEVAARTAILRSKARMNMQYQLVAGEIDLTAARTSFVSLGGMPVPTSNPAIVDDIIEKGMDVEPDDWNLTISISQNAIDDDQTGNVENQFRNLMPAFQRHFDTLVFQTLNAGDTNPYGLGYDGLTFFNDAHVDAGGKNQTGQDNKFALALSLDNLDTVWGNTQSFKDDQGNFTQFGYDLLIVHPTQNKVAHDITGNPRLTDGSQGDSNPYAGQLRYITSPYMDSTAWVLAATGEIDKPIYVCVRKRPELQDMWFDAQQPDGGRHYFKYHGRYKVVYGDWRLAAMGQS